MFVTAGADAVFQIGVSVISDPKSPHQWLISHTRQSTQSGYCAHSQLLMHTHLLKLQPRVLWRLAPCYIAQRAWSEHDLVEPTKHEQPHQSPQTVTAATLWLSPQVASALKDGKVVVHPDWLLACKSGWRCADTAPYLIRPGQQYQGASKEATAEAWAAAAGWNGTGGSSRRQGGAEADLQAALRGAGGGGTT